MNDTDARNQPATAEQERMLMRVADTAAKRLTPIETHSICALLSMAFGMGNLQSRMFARRVNAVRRSLGLPQITQTAAGNPPPEEKVAVLQRAMENLGEEVQALLVQVLLLSPFYAAAESDEPEDEE
jgi:hypothetical protein